MRFIEATLHVDEYDLDYACDQNVSFLTVEMTLKEFTKLKRVLTQYFLSPAGISSVREGEDVGSLSSISQWVNEMRVINETLVKMEHQSTEDLKAALKQKAEDKKKKRILRLKKERDRKKDKNICPYFMKGLDVKNCLADEEWTCDESFAKNSASYLSCRIQTKAAEEIKESEDAV